MKTTPSQLMVGLSLLAVVSAFASDPTPNTASSASSTPVSQEATKVFIYQPKPQAADPSVVPVLVPVVALGNQPAAGPADPGTADAANAVPLKMEQVQVKESESPDKQARALNEAMAWGDPAATRALYTKELRHNLQFEAFGAPIEGTWGENSIHAEQPRFPIVGLNW